MSELNRPSRAGCRSTPGMLLQISQVRATQGAPLAGVPAMLIIDVYLPRRQNALEKLWCRQDFKASVVMKWPCTRANS